MQALANLVTPKVNNTELGFLALGLGLDKYEFKRIESNHPFNAQRQALEVLNEWEKKDTNFTWKFLIEALRAQSVNLPGVAKAVEQWVKDPNNIN